MEVRHWKASSTAELQAVAAELIALCPYDKKFAFYGPMGVGKTTFIAAICRHLGVRDQSGSPTFAIVREYNCGEPVYHLDCYRLRGVEEAMDAGIGEILDGPDFCFIEWPERIDDLLANEVVRIEMELTDDNTPDSEPIRLIRLISANNDN